jgi:hypothetical protein
MSPDDLAEASAAADVILADFTDMTEKLSVEKSDAVSP